MVISLVPPIVDLAFYAGDGAGFAITAADASGAPMDVSGQLDACVRATTTGPVLATFLIDASGAAQGVLRLSLDGAQTAALIGPGTSFVGVWDCQWQAPGADVLTLVRGHVTCNPDVTRI